VASSPDLYVAMASSLVMGRAEITTLQNVKTEPRNKRDMAWLNPTCPHAREDTIPGH
jgi:hypothetical protein